jgi:hypothetical protein
MNSNNLQIPKEVRQKIDRELQPGESIRLVEQPVAQMFTSASLPVLFFAIPWTSFSIFWICGASGFKVPDFSRGIQPEHLFPLFGIPFVLIGLGMLSSPFWAWQAARKTVYLITNKRVILIQSGVSTTIRSYTPAQINHTYRKEGRNGIGDVIIAVRKWKDSDGDQMTEEIGFIGIRNPQEVEKMLRNLAETGF